MIKYNLSNRRGPPENIDTVGHLWEVNCILENRVQRLEQIVENDLNAEALYAQVLDQLKRLARISPAPIKLMIAGIIALLFKALKMDRRDDLPQKQLISEYYNRHDPLLTFNCRRLEGLEAVQYEPRTLFAWAGLGEAA